MRPNRHDARVLVVDDEEDVRDMMAAVLGDEGYDVVTAPDGASAIQAVRAAHVDVALLDLRMPGMGGRDTLAALRAIDPGLVVIVASGHATLEERQACSALEAEVITKPFSVLELMSVIDRALEDRRGRVAHPAEPATPEGVR